MAPFFTGITRALGGGGFGFGRRISFFTSGGTQSISGLYTVHTFTSPGTFTYFGYSPSLTSADLLVVAGGGAGGKNQPDGHGGGGGGAGGYTYVPGFNIATQPQGNSITVVVGNGGSTPSASGGDSTFGSVTSYGGGGGGSGGQGASGGSGGGFGVAFQPGATDYSSGGSATRGNHPLSLGNPGGGARNEGISNSGGGGGGASSQGYFGSNYPNSPGGTGAGLSNSIGGTSGLYAYGGGSSPEGYRANSGHGGTAAPSATPPSPQNSLGSPGVVIIRYLTPT